MKDLSTLMLLCIIEFQDGKQYLAIEHGNNYYCLERGTHYTRGLDYDDIRHVEYIASMQAIYDSGVTYNEEIAAQIYAYRIHNAHLV